MVKVCHDEESVAQAAAEIFVEQYKIAMRRSDRFSVVLSGGNTPERTYECLAEEHYKSQVDWGHVHVFWSDERCVAVTDSRSNYGMAYQTFLSHVSIPSQQIHPIFCTQDPHKSAVKYEALLRQYFGDSPPAFDLVFLGLGMNGHTASLFPDSSALIEKTSWVMDVQNTFESFPRITLTSQLLNLAKMVVFLVIGQEKSDILKQVLAGDESQDYLPARLIHPNNGSLLWLVDSAAMPSLLKPKKDI